MPVVVIRSAAQRLVLHVDEMIGNEKVVVEPLGPQLSRLPGLAGMTLLPSGQPAPICNPVALAHLYGAAARAAARAALERCDESALAAATAPNHAPVVAGARIDADPGSVADAEPPAKTEFAEPQAGSGVLEQGWRAAPSDDALPAETLGNQDNVLGAVVVYVVGLILLGGWWAVSQQPAPVNQLPAADASLLAVASSATRYRKLEALLQVAGCRACGEMSVIEAGEFEMGSPESEPERKENEGPVRKVKVSRFEIGRTAVTQGQWKAVMGGDNPSYFKQCGDACPVEQVSWNDITGKDGFLAKLKEKTGVSYRLASEAEREFATRAGTKTAFWWGDAIEPEQANYNSNRSGVSRARTVRANAFEANAWGLYNVHGNLWEFVQDCWHDNYKGAPETGAAWETGCSGTSRVVRGGSGDNRAIDLRSANRVRLAPENRNGSIGLRLARTL